MQTRFRIWTCEKKSKIAKSKSHDISTKFKYIFTWHANTIENYEIKITVSISSKSEHVNENKYITKHASFVKTSRQNYVYFSCNATSRKRITNQLTKHFVRIETYEKNQIAMHASRANKHSISSWNSNMQTRLEIARYSVAAKHFDRI